MDSPIDYFFGAGDGHITSWVSGADGDLDDDGHLDAVRLDFDGDGRRDDAMWDTDGNGRADVAALDRDDDGVADSFYRDSGAGLWDRHIPRPQTSHPHDVPPPAGRLVDPAERPPPPSTPAPSPAPAPLVRAEHDLDHDGHTELEVVGPRNAGSPVGQRLYIDENGDGTFDRVLVDRDGDGRADVTYDRRSPQFGRD